MWPSGATDHAPQTANVVDEARRCRVLAKIDAAVRARLAGASRRVSWALPLPAGRCRGRTGIIHALHNY